MTRENGWIIGSIIVGTFFIIMVVSNAVSTSDSGRDTRTDAQNLELYIQRHQSGSPLADTSPVNQYVQCVVKNARIMVNNNPENYRKLSNPVSPYAPYMNNTVCQHEKSLYLRTDEHCQQHMDDCLLVVSQEPMIALKAVFNAEFGDNHSE